MTRAYSINTQSVNSTGLYENRIFYGLPEGIRPGGLELTQHLVGSCGFRPGALIADAGCGTGISMDFISHKYGFDVAGIDLSPLLLGIAHERSPLLRLVRARGESFPFRDRSFDGVLCECAMSVMQDKKSFLRETNRILAEKGKLAVSDVYIRRPEFSSMIRGLPLNSCITGAMTHDEIVGLLKDTGFRIILWEDCSGIWKSFIAKLIMENGSLCGIPGCGLSAYGYSFPAAAVKARPGYYCMIAEKK